MSTRFGKKPGGYLWALLEPVAYISLMTLLFSLLARMPVIGESYPLFFATGYLSFNMYRGMERYLSSAVSSNKNLLSYPIVAPIDAVAARFALQAITSAMICIVILSAIMADLSHPVEIHWIPIVQASVFAWVLALGMSMINIVMFAKYPLYQQVYSIVTRPLALLSGVFYVPAMLPGDVNRILLSNPICHVVILFREGFYQIAGSDDLDLQYLAECAAVIFFVGMVTFTLARGAKTIDN